MAAATPSLSSTLIQGVSGVIQQIYSDCAEMCDSNACLIEMACDADRLVSFGFAEANAEFKRLVAEFGYLKVMKALGKVGSLNYI